MADDTTGKAIEWLEKQAEEQKKYQEAQKKKENENPANTDKVIVI